jgi:UDPglucose--hexose-1-phosphate uridylyltransferase
MPEPRPPVERARTFADSDLPYRVDPLTGDVTYVVATRQGRPNLPSSGCPFCPGGIEAPEQYEVFSFPNRWPPIPDGRSEVVLYSPIHDATFWSLGVDGARKVIDLWAERSAVLGARDDVHYVLVFENRGPEVGATIAHPHGQIYAYDVVPPLPFAELTRGTDAVRSLGAEAAGPAGERLVAAHGGWRAWVPWAATSPYELLVAPEAPVPDLPSLTADGRDGFAHVLVDVLERYDRLFDAPMPYMLWIHQRPFDGRDWPGAWVHVHLAPLHRSAGTPRFVAAAEQGGRVFYNPVDPDEAARQLRAANGS